MHIVFISTSIPPYPDMHSIRNIFLIKGLEKRGHKVSIITADYKWGNDNMLDMLSPETKIYKTTSPLLIRLSKFLNQNRYMGPFKKVFNVLVNYIAIPDIHMFWQYEAKKVINSIVSSGEQIDVVVTSSGSYIAHILGNWMSSKFDVPWVAEYGDPWGMDEFGRVRKLQLFIEKKVLRNCGGVVFTTQSTIDSYKNHMKKRGLDLNYKLITGGYNSIINDIKNYESDKMLLQIGYTGVAYTGNRNLTPVIESISSYNDKLRLSIIGNYSESFKTVAENISDNVEFSGRVSYQTSIELISQMDVLLHIGNKGKMQVPGKTYIYLSSKKPIIYIKQEETDDPTYNILRQFDGIIYCNNNVESISEAFNDLIINYQSYKNEADRRSSSELIKKYSYDSLSNEFALYVEEVSSRI